MFAHKEEISGASDHYRAHYMQEVSFGIARRITDGCVPMSGAQNT